MSSSVMVLMIVRHSVISPKSLISVSSFGWNKLMSSPGWCDHALVHDSQVRAHSFTGTLLTNSPLVIPFSEPNSRDSAEL